MFSYLRKAGVFIGIVGKVIKLTFSSAATYVDVNGKRLYVLATAITANVTTTTAPIGSHCVTTHATGQGSLFYSDGSKWQVQVTGATVKATGAELITGTDDAKFATAKALADSEYVDETALEAYAHPLVTPATHIADPTGATTDTDVEARAAIGDILDALEAAGIVAGA